MGYFAAWPTFTVGCSDVGGILFHTSKWYGYASKTFEVETMPQVLPTTQGCWGMSNSPHLYSCSFYETGSPACLRLFSPRLHTWFLLVSPSHHLVLWILFLLPGLLKKGGEEGEITLVIPFPFPFPPFPTYSEYGTKLLLILYHCYGEVIPFLFILLIICNFRGNGITCS